MLTKKDVRCLLVSFAIIIGSTTPTLAQTSAAKSQPASRIVSAIDDSVRLTIKGSAPAQARPENDIGALDPTTRLDRMMLVIGDSPDQEYQARTLLDSQQTKGSPDYHHWLTPEEYGQKFGPSAQDLAQVTGWLAQRGFTVTSVAKSGRWIEFSGTSAQVESAFQTQMRQYMVKGEVHVANASNISIPAALSPVVKGVASLHNFFSKPMLARRAENVAVVRNAGKPDLNFSDGSHGIAPGDLSTIYDLKALYNATPTNLNGQGKTIAVVTVSNINLSDISTFRSIFGLPANTPNVILNGPDPGVDPGDAGVEATLDTEWSGAAAPNATIDAVVSAGSLTTDPILLGSTFIVDQNLADVVSVSFGACESLLGNNPVDGNSFWSAVWQQAAAQGISVFVASGDTGAAGCDGNAPSNTEASGGLGISGFASTPFNTAVGGTEFNETVSGGSVSTFWATTPNADHSSALGYIPEAAWNDSCTPNQANTLCAGGNQFLFDSTGGGVSTQYSVPSYQTLNVTGLSALNNFTLPGSSVHPRGIPDVSLSAALGNDPYIYCFTALPNFQGCSGGFVQVAGGTSFSSPAFAGIMAIVDQKMAAVEGTNGREGLANYVLYSLAASTLSGCTSNSRTVPSKSTTCVFNDITQGTNGVPGNDITNDPTSGALGFPSNTGYDLATGLGSVDANNLVNAWAAATFSGSQTTITTPANPINITHGTAVSFTVNVQKAGGGAGPTGSASVVTSLAAPQGGDVTVGSGTLVSGSFTTTLSDLPGGTYNVTAHYPGDGTFAASDSGPVSATVAPEGSTVGLQSLIANVNTGRLTNGSSVVYGDTVHLLAVDADVAGASGLAPTSGNVQFTVNSQTFSVPVNNSGIAEFQDCFTPNPISNSNCLLPGTYNFSATYGGDGTSYKASGASNSVTITVINPFSFSAVSQSQTVAAGQTATYTLTLTGTAGFTGAVTIACAGAPGGATCAANPATANLSATTTSVPVTITVSNTASARVAPLLLKQLPFAFAGILGIAIVGLRRKPRQRLLAIFAIFVVAGLSACGGGNPPPPPTNATLTVTGTSAPLSSTLTLNLTVTH